MSNFLFKIKQMIVLRRLSCLLAQCILLVILPLCSNAQVKPLDVTTLNDYIPPLANPTRLSASYGELRSNHFHSGLDFKTEQRTGLPVRAVADGYVSRISVMPGGYGKCIYLTHNDGYTSVYAHLDKFNKDIDNFIKSKQYLIKSFALNIDTLTAKCFTFKQGDIIAYSGNSGGSGGPHLHFEIRETDSECPITPIYPALKIRDKTPPQVSRIKIYAESNATKIAGKNADKKFEIKYINGQSTINEGVPVAIAGGFSLGINAIDQTDGETNRNGIRGYDIFIDDTLVYNFDIDKFSFADTRFINTVMDYSEFKNNRTNYYRTYIVNGNPLQFYNTKLNRGIFLFNDVATHKIKIVVYDHFDNKRILKFDVKSQAITTPDILNKPTQGVLFKHDRFNSHTVDGFKIEAEAKAFFEDVDLIVTINPQRENTLSSVYTLDRNTPLFKPVTVTLDGSRVPANLKDKSFIVSIDKNGKRDYVGGDWDGNNLTAKTSSLGSFSIAHDIVPPVIKPVNISENKVISSQGNITLTLSDDFSGVNKITPHLNGKWILMDWDPKFKTLRYTFDQQLVKGRNVFDIQVTDRAGNVSNLKMNLIN